MPTNVSVEYAKSEMEYQKAKTTPEKLKCLNEMLRLAPSHKGGETLRAEIKTKISKLKEKSIKEKEQKKTGAYSLSVKKEGAAQIVLVGPTNTGKSSLLNTLTKAKSAIGHYPFTTSKPEIGALMYNTVNLQIVDLPPLMEDAAIKQAPLMAVIRNADLVVFVLDDLTQFKWLLKEFQESNIILNRKRPAIKIHRGSTGGLEFIGSKLINADLDAVKKVLRDHGIANASIEIFSEVKLEDFFEVLDEKLAYIPALVALNKVTTGKLKKEKGWQIVPISSSEKYNLDILKDKMWELLELVKVFTKEPGKQPTKTNPVTLKKGSTIKDMAVHVHKDFIKKFKYARVWGKSAKHDGAAVGMEHILADDDIVEVHLK